MALAPRDAPPGLRESNRQSMRVQEDRYWRPAQECEQQAVHSTRDTKKRWPRDADCMAGKPLRAPSGTPSPRSGCSPVSARCRRSPSWTKTAGEVAVMTRGVALQEALEKGVREQLDSDPSWTLDVVTVTEPCDGSTSRRPTELTARGRSRRKSSPPPPRALRSHAPGRVFEVHAAVVGPGLGLEHHAR